jgi:hypothetical protein
VTPAAVLARARGSGLVLSVHGDRLHWRGPRPPTDLLAELSAHKAGVLVLLAAEAELDTVGMPSGTAKAPVSETRNVWGMTEAERRAALAWLQPRTNPIDALRALRRAAMPRPPSWADSAALPSRGCFCSCCRSRQWWGDARGWRCWTCHPPDHLSLDAVAEIWS